MRPAEYRFEAAGLAAGPGDGSAHGGGRVPRDINDDNDNKNTNNN